MKEKEPKAKRGRGRPRIYVMPEPIPDTPENMIYSDDRDLAQFAIAQGISVTTVSQLPLPPAEAQMDFAWDIVHEDDATEDEGEFQPEEP